MKLLAIMDPVESIHHKKDSTLALLLEAQKRNWELFYCQQNDLSFSENKICAFSQSIKVKDDESWVIFNTPKTQSSLRDFDVILMRKDPPFDRAYLYATYLLELAQNEGCYIVNHPGSIRDANEKLYPLWFPKICPPLLVSSNLHHLREFIKQHQKIVVKPLHGMAGQSVFILKDKDTNINVTLELLTHQETMPIMAQVYLPEIKNGDKRILMINGEPYQYALSRMPALDDFRGNLAKGAKGVGTTLTEQDRYLCTQVGPTLKAKGLFFVGLDVIGNFVTEINVTSPTGIREIEAAFNVNVCDIILDSLVKNKTAKP